MIKAIETQYAGTRFRSRLEADYAATFNSIGLPWQYEPEGFELSDGTWYSPDFYLPSARAWCEVKGDHQERVSKVEQFAADLWKDAEQPEYEDPDAPMVILARTPGRVVTREYDSPRLTGIRGPGKRYSLGLARCPHCQQTTVIAYWSRLCRACGHVHHDALQAWQWSVMDHYLTKFVSLPRPAGKGRR